MRNVYFWLVPALLIALLLSGCVPIQPAQPPEGTATPASSTAGEATTTITDTAGMTDTVEVTATQETTTSTELTDTASVSLPEGVQEATFVGSEYSYEGPESLPAGWTRLTLDNQGALAHDLFLFKIEEGRTLEDVMTALEAEGPPEWAEFYGVTTAQANKQNWFITNLTPGSYVYLSFGEGQEGPPDAAQGMIGTLTVTPATAAVAADLSIPADVRLEMVDYQFIITGEFQPGEQVVEVANTGEEMHEAVIYRLREGTTFEDFQALLAQEMSGTPTPEETEMPFDFSGNVFLSPGLVYYTPVTLQAGDHIFICYLPSLQHDGTPHFELGMVQQVTIE